VLGPQATLRSGSACQRMTLGSVVTGWGCWPGVAQAMYETEQIEFRLTDRERFHKHLLRNGPRAVQECANAVKLWEQRPPDS